MAYKPNLQLYNFLVSLNFIDSCPVPFDSGCDGCCVSVCADWYWGLGLENVDVK